MTSLSVQVYCTVSFSFLPDLVQNSAKVLLDVSANQLLVVHLYMNVFCLLLLVLLLTFLLLERKRIHLILCSQLWSLTSTLCLKFKFIPASEAWTMCVVMMPSTNCWQPSVDCRVFTSLGSQPQSVSVSSVLAGAQWRERDLKKQRKNNIECERWLTVLCERCRKWEETDNTVRGRRFSKQRQ